VTTSYGEDKVYVFRNTTEIIYPTPSNPPTRSTFSDAQKFSTGKGPKSLAICDMYYPPGLGHMDLAVANWDGKSVSFLRNMSSGDNIDFNLNEEVRLGYSPAAIAVDDLTGDYNQELVVANYEGGTISVYNTIISPPRLSIKSIYSTGVNPNCIAITNLNYYGAQYFAVTNESSNNVSIVVSRYVQSTGMSLAKGWNLVSIPLLQSNYTPDVVFPGKSGSIFEYNTAARSYNSASVLACGKGYWVLY
jgi:hypothetical protein